MHITIYLRCLRDLNKLSIKTEHSENIMKDEDIAFSTKISKAKAKVANRINMGLLQYKR